MNAVRTTPHATDSEAALLGALMLEPEAIAEVSVIVRPGDFYRPDHARLYELLLRLSVTPGEHIDSVSVGQHVLRGDAPEAFGGFAYVLGLTDRVPSRSNAAHYATTVREMSQRRRILRIAEELSDAAADTGRPIDEATAAAVSALTTLEGAARSPWVTLAEALAEAEAQIEAATRGGAPVGGVPMPFPSLAKYVRMLGDGEVYVIAARPGMGKSALARDIALSVASLEDADVAVFSLEMTPAQIASLALSRETGLSQDELKGGRMDQEAWRRVGVALEALEHDPVWFCREMDLTVEEVGARCRQLAARLEAKGRRLRMVVVDYLQLLNRRGLERMNTNDAVAHQSRALKVLAGALGCPLVLLSQLNREVEKRGDKRPNMADLRDSGAIEQDASVILFPFRPAAVGESPDATQAEMIVAKNRTGERGTAHMLWSGARVSYYDPCGSEQPDGNPTISLRGGR